MIQNLAEKTEQRTGVLLQILHSAFGSVQDDIITGSVQDDIITGSVQDDNIMSCRFGFLNSVVVCSLYRQISGSPVISSG